MAAVSPDFTPPARPAPNRNARLEIALNNLGTAFETFARVPGGDLDGLRPKVNSGIASAASTIIVGINAANEDFLQRRRASTSPPPAAVP